MGFFGHPDHRAVARILLGLLCGLQGLATLAIDLNRTHATNPLWPRHARFHLVWQDFSIGLLSAFQIALLFWRGRFADERFYLVAALAAIPMLAFLGAFLARRSFGGALNDPNGIPPARITLFGTERSVDLNLAAELVAPLVLIAVVALYTR